MVNPIAVAGCLAIGLGGLAFVLIGGDSRADKRRAAVARSDAKALSASATVDRTARKKQIADGLRDIEMKGRRRRVSLATRIEQAGLSITKQQYWIGSPVTSSTHAGEQQLRTWYICAFCPWNWWGSLL